MAVYVAYLIVITLECLLLEINSAFKKRKVFIAVACIELIIVVGLRAYFIGADTATYLQVFDYYKSFDLTYILSHSYGAFGFEKGYMFLTKVVSMLGMNETAFLFLLAAFMYIPFFYMVNKYSKFPLVSIFSYFAFNLFAYSLGIFRQVLAVTICFCLTPYIIERKILKFFLGVLIAALFHQTAICFVVVYIVYGLNLKKVSKFILPATVLALISGSFITKLALLILPGYTSYVGSQHDVRGGSYMMLLLLVCIYVICQFFFVEKHNIQPIEELSAKGLYLAIILQAASYSFGLMGRVVPYYSIYLTLLIPSVIDKGVSKNSKVVAVGCTIAALFVIAVFTQFYGNKYICPFRFVWQM